MACYADLGHEEVALYLTPGEAGIRGKSHQEAARIRTAEAEMACTILKARPVFAGQINGSTEVTAETYREFTRLLTAEKPDLVFAPWPLDTHRDHRATSLLVYDAWLRMKQKFEPYYTEVMSGMQTQAFRPYGWWTSAQPRLANARPATPTPARIQASSTACMN